MPLLHLICKAGLEFFVDRCDAIYIAFLVLIFSRLRASRPAEQGESPHDAGSNLLVLGLGVAVALELGRLAQQRSTEPRSMPLPLVTDDLHIEAA
jgi:hypothetical protein